MNLGDNDRKQIPIKVEHVSKQNDQECIPLFLERVLCRLFDGYFSLGYSTLRHLHGRFTFGILMENHLIVNLVILCNKPKLDGIKGQESELSVSEVDLTVGAGSRAWHSIGTPMNDQMLVSKFSESVPQRRFGDELVYFSKEFLPRPPLMRNFTTTSIIQKDREVKSMKCISKRSLIFSISHYKFFY